MGFNIGKALGTLGKGLGQMANFKLQQERDEANFIKEKNMTKYKQGLLDESFKSREKFKSDLLAEGKDARIQEAQDKAKASVLGTGEGKAILKEEEAGRAIRSAFSKELEGLSKEEQIGFVSEIRSALDKKELLGKDGKPMTQGEKITLYKNAQSVVDSKLEALLVDPEKLKALIINEFGISQGSKVDPLQYVDQYRAKLIDDELSVATSAISLIDQVEKPTREPTQVKQSKEQQSNLLKAQEQKAQIEETLSGVSSLQDFNNLADTMLGSVKNTKAKANLQRIIDEQRRELLRRQPDLGPADQSILGA